ncbi:MAG: hypothetical protein Q9219_001355 [cf. Caloplaca sp. 3 TL-2023]
MDQFTKDEAAKVQSLRSTPLIKVDGDTDSLIRYLEYYCNFSSFSARNAKLESVTLDSLAISAGSRREPSLIPLRPAMSAWSEARARFADLDAQAVAGLKRSSITIKRYDRPRGWLTKRRRRRLAQSIDE